MANTNSNLSVDHDVQDTLTDILDQIQVVFSLCHTASAALKLRDRKVLRKKKKPPSKRRIFSSSEDDTSSSSSSDESHLSEIANTLVADDESDEENEDERKILRNRSGPRTHGELVLDELPPIENLTITLSDETPMERIGHIRHIIDGKLIIIESLLHSPPLNDDSVLFNRDRRSIGLVFETFGPVEKPYYSIRYNNMENIQQRGIEIGLEVFYAPKETTYTKYVFVQELRALKGSDASWEDDNEPPKFAVDYSDDEQERTAKALAKRKRITDDDTDVMDSVSNTTADNDDLESVVSNYSNVSGRGRGRGRGRGFRRGATADSGRPPPSLPNWFQNSPNPNRPRFPQHQTTWQNPNVVMPPPFSNDSQQQQPFQGGPTSQSVFPWM